MAVSLSRAESESFTSYFGFAKRSAGEWDDSAFALATSSVNAHHRIFEQFWRREKDATSNLRLSCATMSEPKPAAVEPAKPADCLACRITGTLTFAAVGTYALTVARQSAKTTIGRGSASVVGLGQSFPAASDPNSSLNSLANSFLDHRRRSLGELSIAASPASFCTLYRLVAPLSVPFPAA